MACALAVGAALLVPPGPLAAESAPLPATATPGPLSCVLEVAGRDAAGNTVLQTVGYALDRPGLLLAHLSTLAPGAARWRSLSAAPDPLGSGPAFGPASGAASGPASGVAGSAGASRPSAGSADVTEFLLEDPERDLVLLRAPGLGACEAGVTAAVPAEGAGESWIGIRNREGYRGRVYRAQLDRTIPVRGGPDLLRVRIPDGGGAGSGFLLDGRRRLIASILPAPSGADRLLACAVPIDSKAIDTAAGSTGRPPLEASSTPRSPGQASRTPAAILAQALLLTRDDQADRALALLDEVVGLIGESDVLLMERGAWRFRIGRSEAAILDFARAAALNPRLLTAHLNLGVALGTTGRYPEAADALKRALSIDPYNAPAHYQLALALAAAKHRDQARGEYERLRLLDAAMARDLGALLQF
jgi:hypothetical protein